MKQGEHPLSDDIASLEAKSRALELDSPHRQELFDAVSQYSNEFLDTLAEQKAYSSQGYDPSPDDVILKPGPKSTISELLSYLSNRVDTPGINLSSGGHFGFIPGGGLYEAALGDYLAAVTNRYAGVFYASPGAVRMENAMVRWAGEVIGYRGDFGGNLSSGGSMANLTAIATARHAKNIKNRDSDSTVIYTTRRTHHSVYKALKVSGLHECIMRHIDLDANYRMDVGKLEEQIKSDLAAGLKPFMCIINAGSTDLGAVDPLIGVSKVTKAYDLWLHVDAAYGGFFMLTKWGQQILKGIELADSVILDPHKGMFLPYGTGIVLVKDKKHLLDTFLYNASYLQDIRDREHEDSPTDLSAELSKHFRGLRMWIPLKIHGVQPFRDSLDEKLLLTRYLWDHIRELGFEMGPYPDLTVMIFRYTKGVDRVDDLNHKILNDIQEDGRTFTSSTTIDGKFYLRAAILSFRSHKEQVDLFIMMIKESLQRHLKEHLLS